MKLLIEIGRYLSYYPRPYDMLADRRRWFWQKPMRCGLPPMPDDIRAELMAAIERHLATQEGQ